MPLAYQALPPSPLVVPLLLMLGDLSGIECHPLLLSLHHVGRQCCSRKSLNQRPETSGFCLIRANDRNAVVYTWLRT
ncbi:hypothetical protein EDB85DRAFT_211574 [Lactarius pseudohatsudake]|nr:hypothetical protein EDB85DRAFT_211574 [Lactarius pseudohatsudake]